MTLSLSLTSPAALVASLPYLLGFEPRESAVAIWLEGSRVLLTQRLDLPVDPGDAAWQAALWSHAAVPRAERVVVVLVSGRSDLPLLSAAILERADAHEMVVLDVLGVDAGRWRSLLCTDADCCPPEGRALPPEVSTAAAAEFAWLGVASVGERSDLVGSLERDADLSDPVRRELAGRRASPGSADDLEAWRDAAIDGVIAVLTGRADARDPGTAADGLVAVSDVRVRDTVLWTASHWGGERLARAVDALRVIVRAAPPGRLAPVATVFAGLAWLAGDGARAGIALDRALDDDPEYSLARLLAAAVGSGLDPMAWRRTMQSLTRLECRHGSSAVADRVT